MITTLFNYLCSFLYNLIVSPLLLLIDLLQAIFTGFAGIGTIHWGHDVITSGNTGEDTDTGIVYYLLRSSTVRNLFMSLLILALMLLIFFAILTFVKNMYSEKPKPAKDIIVNAIKGLMSFIAMPVIFLFGVWIGNILLQTLFQATNKGGQETLSAQIFSVAAYSANRFRTTGGAIDEHLYNELKKYAPSNYNLPSWEEVQNHPDYMNSLADMADQLYKDRILTPHTTAVTVIFYDMTQFNYIVFIVSAIFMLYALGAITFGCIKRLFFMVFLFVLSPLMNAMYPWDEGNASKSLSKDFYKHTISVYSSVVGLNLFFAILPIIMRISLFDYLYILTADFQNIMSIILMICGLLVVKDLIGVIDGYIGSASSVYSSGASMMNSVKGKVGTGVKGIKTVTGAFARAGGAASKYYDPDKGLSAKGLGVFLGTLGRDAVKGADKVVTGGSLDPHTFSDDTKKAFGEGKKSVTDRTKSKETKADLDQLEDDIEHGAVRHGQLNEYNKVSTFEGLENLMKRVGKEKDEDKQKALWKRILKSGMIATDSEDFAGLKLGKNDDTSLDDAKAAINDRKSVRAARDAQANSYSDWVPDYELLQGLRGRTTKLTSKQLADLRTQLGENAGKILTDDGKLKEGVSYRDARELGVSADTYAGLILGSGATAKEGKEAKERLLTQTTLDEDSTRRMALQMAEQLQRTLQRMETVDHGDAFASEVSNLGAGLQKTIKELGETLGKNGNGNGGGGAVSSELTDKLDKLTNALEKLVEKENPDGTGGGVGG